MPAMELWDVVLGRKVCLDFAEDNETAIHTIKAGGSPTMRHLGRTHNVCLKWLSEVFSNSSITLGYCNTKDMAADVFTKGFTDKTKWAAALSLIGIRTGE